MSYFSLSSDGESHGTVHWVRGALGGGALPPSDSPTVAIAIVVLLVIAFGMNIFVIQQHSTTDIYGIQNYIAVPTGISCFIGVGESGDPKDVSGRGYFLLPLPAGRKEPPPLGWVERKVPYEIPVGGNVAIGMRGDVSCLITNDEQSTSWATTRFGLPNVRTPRGAHWYFRPREGQVNEPNKATPVGTMEFHVRNKYALIPPSVHPSGVSYLLVRPLPAVTDLPGAPDLRELWNPGGEHHDKLRAMSAAKAHAGKQADEILSELASWRDHHLPDPFVHPDRELHTFADSAFEKFHTTGTSPAPILPAAKKEVSSWGIRPPPPGAGLWDSDGAPKLGSFVDSVLTCAHFVSIPESDEVLIYRDGRYVRGAEPMIRAWVEERYKEAGRTAGKNAGTILDGVRNRTYRDTSTFNPAGLLCVENGVLDLASVTVESTGDGFRALDLSRVRLAEHSPEIVFTRSMPVRFDPTVGAPKFREFLQRILPDEKYRDHIEEAFGYVFEKGQPQQTAEMFVGQGDTGKSVLLKVFVLELGKENVASVPLQDIDTDRNRFASSRLVDKWANVCADLGPRAVRNTGRFKELTGGDGIEVESKHQNMQRAEPDAKQYYSCNELPDTPDTSTAHFRRWNITPFKEVIPESEQIAGYEKVLFSAESSGILNVFLGGFARLKARGRFGLDTQVEETKRFWMSRTDPLGVFLSDRLEHGADYRVERSALLVAYQEFAEELDRDTLSPEKVAQRVRAIRGVGTFETSAMIHGRRTKVRYWTGIQLKATQPETAGYGKMASTPSSNCTDFPEGPEGPREGVWKGLQEEPALLGVLGVIEEAPIGSASSRANRAGKPDHKDASAPAPPDNPTGPGRSRHPNCDLCMVLSHHVCIGSHACSWTGAPGPESSP